MSRNLPRSVACLSRHLRRYRGAGVLSANETHGSSVSAAAAAGCSNSSSYGNWSSRGFRMQQIHSAVGSGGRGGARQRAQNSSAVNCDEPDFDPTEARSPPNEKVTRLVDEIASLTLLEVSDLTTLLKKKLGLKGMPMMPMMGMPTGQGPGGAAPAAEEKKPEKTAFDVKLEKFDSASKIKIIKEVRTFTSLGLKEAKELVEKIPALLKKGVSKEEATQIIEKLKAVGGTAVME